MATKKKDSKPKRPALPPLAKTPDWRDKLTATTFEEGRAEAWRHVSNAKKYAKLAGKIDDDRFKDTKYSSAAAQFGYIAVLKLIQGFAAEYPLDQALWNSIAGVPGAEAAQAKRELFEREGLATLGSYRSFIKITFGKGKDFSEFERRFDLLRDSLHVKFHYGYSADRRGFYSAIADLEDFLKKLEQEAVALYRKAGVAI